METAPEFSDRPPLGKLATTGGSAANVGASIQVAMVAGEASGDWLAGFLIDGLKTPWPAF